MNYKNKLQEIFCEIFDDENLVIENDMTSDDIDGWDSLVQINIISICETTFNVKFDINEIISIKSVSDILALLDNKVSQ